MKRGAFFYVLIVLAAAALGCLIWFLAPGAAPETPPVVLSPPPAQASEAPASEAPADDPVLEITPDTVQAVITTLTRADSYSRTLTVQNFWNGGSATNEIEVHARGESVRLSIRSPGSAEEKNVLIRGDEAWIWYTGRTGSWHGPARAGDADAYQTLLTYEDVLGLDRSAILDAGYADYNGESCIRVRYVSGALGYESLCYISDATGLLMGTETYDGDVLVYTMRSSRPDISTPGDEFFTEPYA